MNIHFVTGGARSGKSRYAEQLALRLGAGDEVAYIATAVACDDEMSDRIALHRARRPAGWITIETETDATAALRRVEQSVVLLDCLTLLVSNLFLSGAAAGAAEARKVVLTEVDRLIESAQRRTGELLIVSNEVGSAIVPETPYGRWFRDILGEANQRVAGAATSVTLVVAGCSLQLKPGTATV
jgi:adenosylcobinamide kinase / adenosylcobinamide-phosphate guanylyltransferase